MSVNRAYRRQEQRQKMREWVRDGTAERVRILSKNGLTEKDLKEEYAEGHKIGYELGAERALKMAYAAIVLELLQAGNPKDDVMSFLVGVDQRVMTSIDANEDIEQVFRETGIKLQLKDELERVRW